MLMYVNGTATCLIGQALPGGDDIYNNLLIHYADDDRQRRRRRRGWHRAGGRQARMSSFVGDTTRHWRSHWASLRHPATVAESLTQSTQTIYTSFLVAARDETIDPPARRVHCAQKRLNSIIEPQRTHFDLQTAAAAINIARN